MAQYLTAHRFWVATSKSCVLDQNGYLLLGPPGTSLRDALRGAPPAASQDSHATPSLLDHWQDVPVLILLGEAGLGKTIAIEQFLATPPATDCLIRKRIDFGEFGSEDALVGAIFDSREAKEWLNGTHVLDLWLDSSDESRLRFENIARRLGRELLEKWQSHKNRLRLRTACRSLIWPAIPQEQLEQLWSKPEEDREQWFDRNMGRSNRKALKDHTSH